MNIRYRQKQWMLLPASERSCTVMELASYHKFMEQQLDQHVANDIGHNLKILSAWDVYLHFLLKHESMAGMNTRGYKQIVVRALSQYAHFLCCSLKGSGAVSKFGMHVYRKKVKRWFKGSEREAAAILGDDEDVVMEWVEGFKIVFLEDFGFQMVFLKDL